MVAKQTVCEGIRGLKSVLTDERQLAYIHRIDNVLFMHGGLADPFVKYYAADVYDDTDAVIDAVNQMGGAELWDDASPLWYRPQYGYERMYKSSELLQVVGHTPVEKLERKANLISCDTFSTYRNGKPIGTETFLLIDTRNWEYNAVK